MPTGTYLKKNIYRDAAKRCVLILRDSFNVTINKFVLYQNVISLRKQHNGINLIMH